MTRVKTYEFRKRLYSEIPEEVAKALGLKSGDELEYAHVHGRVAAVFPTKPEQAQAAPAKSEEAVVKKLSLDEDALVRKLSSIRYYDRLADETLKKCSAREREIFDALVKRKVLFKYVKNKKEFIGVSREYYPSAMQTAKSGPALSPVAENLMKRGFIVLENQGEADRLSRELGKEKSVRGIRGFDRKYYLVTEEKLREFEKKLERVLTREKNYKTIADELTESEELAKAALEILREDGTLIEKKRDSYAFA